MREEGGHLQGGVGAPSVGRKEGDAHNEDLGERVVVACWLECARETRLSRAGGAVSHVVHDKEEAHLSCDDKAFPVEILWFVAVLGF